MPDFCPTTMMSLPLLMVVSMGGVPKSKSGPAFSPQFALPGRHPKTSPVVNCFDHFTTPLSRSNAMIESAVGCSGALYVLPVPTYTTLRLVSMVGADQMPTPDGPHSVDPVAVFPSGCAGGTVKYCQATAPVCASSATRLPRNVQHS